jgi:predicted nucleic acid-binding protein
VLARWDALAEIFDVPTQLSGPGLLHCSDPDDQQFLDLARVAGARWLLSRDRAVLRLTRAAARLNLRITVPEGWSPAE